MGFSNGVLLEEGQKGGFVMILDFISKLKVISELTNLICPMKQFPETCIQKFHLHTDQKTKTEMPSSNAPSQNFDPISEFA